MKKEKERGIVDKMLDCTGWFLSIFTWLFFFFLNLRGALMSNGVVFIFCFSIVIAMIVSTFIFLNSLVDE